MYRIFHQVSEKWYGKVREWRRNCSEGAGRGILNSRTQYYEYMKAAQRFTAPAQILGRRLEGWTWDYRKDRRRIGKFHQPIIGAYFRTGEIRRTVTEIDHQKNRGLSFPVRKEHLGRRCTDVHDGSKGERAGISHGAQSRESDLRRDLLRLSCIKDYF